MRQNFLQFFSIHFVSLYQFCLFLFLLIYYYFFFYCFEMREGDVISVLVVRESGRIPSNGFKFISDYAKTGKNFFCRKNSG